MSVIATFPPDTHPPIRYPMIIPAESVSPLAETFAEYLEGASAGAVFRHHGFGHIGAGG